MRRTRALAHRKRAASYEVLVNNSVRWRGRKLGRALNQLSRQHPKAKLSVRWIPGPELLVVLETL